MKMMKKKKFRKRGTSTTTLKVSLKEIGLLSYQCMTRILYQQKKQVLEAIVETMQIQRPTQTLRAPC